MESRWLSVLVAGASVALLSGCGSSVNELPAASGKLTQDDANKTLQSIRSNGGLGSFNPSNLLVPNKGKSGGRTSKFIGFESLAKRSNKEVSSQDAHIKGDEKKWTEDCEYHDNNGSFKYGGTVTVTVIHGTPYHYFDTKTKSIKHNDDENGSATVQVETKDCVSKHGVKETGTVTLTEKWSGQHTHNHTGEVTREYTSGYTYQYGDNKLEISSGSSSRSYESNASKMSHNSESKFSGTLTIDGKKTTYKNFDVKRGHEETHTDKSYSYKRTSSIYGAFKSDATDGWIVIKTPTEFELDSNKTVSNCLKEGGKLIIEGSDHKLTASALKDHSLEIKYDDKVIGKQKVCKKNSEEQ